MSGLGDWEAGRLAEVEREIAERLRPVCPHIPQIEFETLVKRIAYVRRKYEQRRYEELFRVPDEMRHEPSEQSGPSDEPGQRG